MPDAYAYIISNNKLEPIFARIRSASKPDRVGQQTLATWGFTASNDRAMVSVMKMLGFITESGAPNENYDRLRDPNDWRYVLAERMRVAYADLFSIDSNMNLASETEVRGAMARITGKDEETVARYYATFKTLASLAKFDPKPAKAGTLPKPSSPEAEPAPVKAAVQAPEEPTHRRRSEYHYNIQIHLPVTTDISVYNAIFKSLKENLGI